MIKSYSQCGQDVFVLSLIENGRFLDLGCSLPKKINNTFALEENGWTGISIDIKDYSNEWSIRSSKFICSDCFNLDYKDILTNYFVSGQIDYLSLDMEALGDRFRLAEKVLNSGFRFKIITIEHDSHIGQDFIEKERDPQRKLLSDLGYELVCSDVSQAQYPDSFYEDWWVDPNFFEKDLISKWRSDKMSCDKIFEKMKISYQVDEISKEW